MLLNYYRKTGKISENNVRIIRFMLIPLALFLITIERLITRLFPENDIAAFLSGMLAGLAVVVIIAGIFACRNFIKR